MADLQTLADSVLAEANRAWPEEESYEVLRSLGLLWQSADGGTRRYVVADDRSTEVTVSEVADVERTHVRRVTVTRQAQREHTPFGDVCHPAEHYEGRWP